MRIVSCLVASIEAPAAGWIDVPNCNELLSWGRLPGKAKEENPKTS